MEKTLEAAFQTYRWYRKLPERLLECYDQHGKWIERIRETETCYPKILRRLRRKKLKESRRSIAENGERILLTSYIEYSDEPVIIPWHEIRGRIFVRAPMLSAPNLRRIISNDICAIEADTIRLPELEIARSLLIYGEEFYIPKLETLEIGEIKVSNFSAPSLLTVGFLEITRSLSADLPSLQTAKTAIKSYFVRDFHAPNLTSVNSDSTARIGFELNNAVKIHAPKLKFIGGNCVTYSAPDFHNPSLTVAGEWQMHHKAR